MTEDAASEADVTIGANVRHARERANLSQSEVARLMSEAHVPGFHQTTVARIEKGERPLRLAEALELTLILGVSLTDLLRLPEELLLRDRVKVFREAEAALVSAAYYYEDEARSLGEYADKLIAAGGEDLVRAVLADIDLSVSARDLLAAAHTDDRSVRAAVMEELVRLHAADRERHDQSVDHG